MEVIKDGTGSGYLAKVDSENKLQVRAVQQSEFSHALDEGVTWNIGTGFLTLTSDAQTPLVYIKNTGLVPLEISTYVFLTRASTGGASEDGLIEIVRNPNAGTIVTDETSVSPFATNFSSAKNPNADIYSGGSGKTISGYDGTLRSFVGASSRFLLPIETRLEQGASLGILYTPPTGNTSMEIEVIFELYEEHDS